jgi:hypothetical protein
MVLGGAVSVRHTAIRLMDERGVLWVLTGYAMFIIAFCGFALVVGWKDCRKENANLLRENRRCQGSCRTGRDRLWQRTCLCQAAISGRTRDKKLAKGLSGNRLGGFRRNDL